jgi:hypothetical protein
VLDGCVEIAAKCLWKGKGAGDLKKEDGGTETDEKYSGALLS